MSKVILNALLQAELMSHSNGPVEVCDESGKTLGYFHPLVRPTETLAVQSPFSLEELERRRQQRTGKPLAEILERWEKAR
jgi:hypothetical protein